MELEQKNY